MTTGAMPCCEICGAWLPPVDGPPHMCMHRLPLQAYQSPTTQRMEMETLRAELDSLQTQISELREQRDDSDHQCFVAKKRLAAADIEATSLLMAMAQQWPDMYPDWRSLPDAPGKITQISNMVAGLRTRLAEVERDRDAAIMAFKLTTSLDSLSDVDLYELTTNLREGIDREKGEATTTVKGAP